MRKNAARLAVLVFLFFSCRTDDPVVVKTKSLDEVTSREISRYIEEGSPTKACQWIFSMRSREPLLLSGEELDRLEETAKEKILELFLKAVEDKDYGKAEAWLLSLECLDALPAGFDWNLTKLLFRRAEEYRAAGNEVLALYTFLQIEDYAALSEDELNVYADISLHVNNGSAVKRVADILESRGLALSTEKMAAALKITSPEDMLEGTVTIWVNKGIRLEGGMGFPDRVIGSGFFIDPRGYLLTNYHVISSEVDPKYKGYSRLYIRPSEHPEDRIPARVVGYSRIFDLALLKTEITPDFVFGVTDIEELRVGTRVFAMGSPGGLDKTITAGIVSATSRRFFQMGDAMQMDAPVNPGNSGGPLVDESGRLIGVVFAGIEQFEGVNFAIPGYWILKFLPSLYREGEVIHSWIGLSIFETKRDLEVIYTVPGSPGKEAGIAAGDKILQINGESVTTIRAAQDILLSLEPETLVPVVFQRGEARMTARVALGVRPYSPIEEPLSFEAKNELFPPLFGFIARKLSSGFFSEGEYTVERVYPGTAADEIGISENDPFTLYNWTVDKKRRIVLAQLTIKKRKAGFLEGAIQLGAFFEQNN
ncbi:MAG: S1C family serine protease, partial [Spirochaetaceae bacterium]|nr:S1C family serine protease [Spirochaetaceae bacterium]